MRKILKSSEPADLTAFRRNHPDARWRETKAGKEMAQKCLTQLLVDQHGLCAYCERKIGPHTNVAQVEHFHDKSDTTKGKIWDYEWDTMLAVCNGGATLPQTEGPIRLTCDAQKNRQKQLKNLNIPCEGYILNPFYVPAFPSLFGVAKDGRLFANPKAYKLVPFFADDKYETLKDLITATIDLLNLNSAKLCDDRKTIIKAFDSFKKDLTDKKCPPEKIKPALLSRCWSEPFPEFFTTVRWWLNDAAKDAAEDYLRSINYNG